MQKSIQNRVKETTRKRRKKGKDISAEMDKNGAVYKLENNVVLKLTLSRFLHQIIEETLKNFFCK